MLSSPSVRRRLVAAVGVLSIGATSALSLVAAPSAVAATRTYPVGLKTSPALAVARHTGPMAGATTEPPPASVDLTPWAVPAGDQGQIGSCASWTVGYTISGWYARKQGQTGHPYAPMFLYTQQTNGQGGGQYGTTFYGNLSLEQNGGVDTLADFTQGNYNPSTVPTAAEKANALKYKLTGWTTLYYSQQQSASIGQGAIKDALAHGRPVALGMDVYTNFFNVRANNDHYDAVSGSFAGRHAVTILAYDSYGVKIENSWSAYWGNQGFAWLSWGFVAAHTSEAYSVDGFTAPQAGPAPTLTSISASSGPWTGGGTVTLRGTNLAGAAVTFGTVPSATVAVAADGTSLTALVPMATTGKVAVTATTPTGGATNALDYTYMTAAPTLTTLSATSGSSAGGATVTLTGSNLQRFGSTYSVLFGTVPSATVTAAADGRTATAVVPAGAVGPVDVKIISYGGTSNALRYAYTWPVAPLVTLTTPNATVAPGNVALSGAVRNAKGVGYGGLGVVLQTRPKGSTAAFANAATNVTAANGTVAFSRPITASTEYRLAIVGDVFSPTVAVTVQALASFRSVDPTSGTRKGGQTVTVTGTALWGAAVTIDGRAGTSVAVSADGTSLTFRTPAHAAGTFDLIVTTPVSSTKVARYTYRN